MVLNRFILVFIALIGIKSLASFDINPKKVIFFRDKINSSEFDIESFLWKSYLKSYGIDCYVYDLDAEKFSKEDKQDEILSLGDNVFEQFSLAIFQIDNPSERALELKKQLSSIGVIIFNRLNNVLYLDKAKMKQEFLDNRIPTPKGFIVEVGTDEIEVIRRIQNDYSGMIVIKFDGSCGNRVNFVNINETNKIRDILSKYINENNKLTEPLIIEEYIDAKNSEGFSFFYRVLIVDGEIAGGYKLTSSSLDELAPNFNFSKKTKMEYMKPEDISKLFSSTQLEFIARIPEVMNLVYAGVDIILNEKGFFILEGNSAPSMKYFFAAGIMEPIIKVTEYASRYLK